MLRGIQKATANWLGRVVMGILLGLIAISFAIWGVGDIFRGFGQSTVAKVGKTEIRVDQFRQTYLDQLQQIGRRVGRPITQEQARALGLDRQVLARMIAETVLDERARALGLAISDAEIARRVTEDPAFRGLSGQFDRSRFDQLIRQAGMTEARFLQEQRRNMVRQQLVGSISADVAVPQAAAEALNRYQNEQRAIEYVRLDRSHAGEVPQPSAEELAKYFEERKVMFRAPEYRAVDLLVATPAELSGGVEVSDADLRKAYEERKARYGTPERRHLRQIVFPNMDEAKAAADKLAAGTTFAALAAERKLSDSDTNLGTVAKPDMVDPAIANAAFAIKEGEVSAPVQGRFGVALVQAVKVEPAQTRSFEDVAGELRQDLKTERARADMANIHDKIEDERLGGASLADIAKKLGLSVRKIPAMDRSGRSPEGAAVADLPQGAELLGPIFGADIGTDHDPISVQGGGYVWFEVLDIKPSRDRTLDDVKDQVAARWRDEEISKRLKAKSDAMIEAAKSGKPFGEVAAAANLKAEWLPGLKRSGPTTTLPARAIEEVFRTPKDAVAAVDGASPTERFVFRVTEITVPKFEAESADVNRMTDNLRQSIGEELVAQYLARLEKEIGVSINHSALNQVTGAATN